MQPGWVIAPYIKGFLDPEIQVQPAGVDLTLGELLEFAGQGHIGFRDKALPETRPIKSRGNKWIVGQGAYKAVFNEKVRIPPCMAGLCLPRSTLLRMGVGVYCALWDPGYQGRGEALLVVYNSHGAVLEKGARIAQLFYIRVEGPMEKTYQGSYQEESF